MRILAFFSILFFVNCTIASPDGLDKNGSLKYIYSLNCSVRLGLNDYPLGQRNEPVDSTFKIKMGAPDSEGWQEEQKASGMWSDDLGYSFKFGPNSQEKEINDGPVYSMNYGGHLSIIRYMPDKKIIEGRLNVSVDPSDSYSFQKNKKGLWAYGNNLKFINVASNTKKKLAEALKEADASGEFKIGDWIEVELFCQLDGNKPEDGTNTEVVPSPYLP